MATKKRTSAPAASSASSAGMALWLGVAALVVLVDQLTKITIAKLFVHGQSRPVTSFFNLVLAYNEGAAFSFLSTQGGWQRWLFTGIAIAAAALILYLLKKHAAQRMFCLALSLVMGGALGNLIDRVIYGHVIDFLDFHARGWHWPAFNVADIAICTGAALFVLDELRRVNR